MTALERLRLDCLRLERLRRMHVYERLRYMSVETGEVKVYVFTPRG